MKYILQQHKSSVIRFKYHENHGFTAKRIAYGQKKIKGDSTKCKTHKIKITQLSWCVFLQFNLYFIHIYSRYAFMLLSWRETDREKKGALLAKLITGWQFSKFLRSFLQKKKKLYAHILCITYILHTHEFRCWMNFLFSYSRICLIAFHQLRGISKLKFFDLFTHNLNCTMHK